MATVLKFGKYSGYPITEVPSDYLEFLISNATRSIADYRTELDRRAALEDADKTWMERVVETGYRELAKRYELAALPDALGVDGDRMREINAAVEMLREVLKRVKSKGGTA